jgi:hypothetical protein
MHGGMEAWKQGSWKQGSRETLKQGSSISSSLRTHESRRDAILVEKRH